ncbi:MAG: type II toxin-antitoxin system VapC family toxin [Acidobacteriota bacterium]|nr:type II toxin-antitoxin system VapC family toxin [Acidobacteriota bacterium]
MSIVVDASVLIDALLGDTTAEAAVAGHPIHAPVTIDAEVLHALRRRWLAGVLLDKNASDVIALFRHTPIARHSVQPFIDRIWSLRRNITAYDAGYVALAESLNVPLLTRDWRLAHSAGHTARIEYIA